jgi:hypothetical protein
MGTAHSIPEIKYDMVLSCPLTDLCDSETPKGGSKPCWKIQVEDDRNLGDWHGRVVGILGYLNRGKTWVVGRLSDCKFLSEGNINRTEGLSFKWIGTQGQDQSGKSNDDDSGRRLIIDTAGFSTPILWDKAESSIIAGYITVGSAGKCQGQTNGCKLLYVTQQISHNNMPLFA